MTTQLSDNMRTDSGTKPDTLLTMRSLDLDWLLQVGMQPFVTYGSHEQVTWHIQYFLNYKYEMRNKRNKKSVPFFIVYSTLHNAWFYSIEIELHILFVKWNADNRR